MASGVAPVGLEEQVVTGEIQEGEQPIVCRPSSFGWIAGVEQTEAVVGHAVGRGQSVVGEHPWIVLRRKPIGVVERAGFESDLYGNGFVTPWDIESLVAVEEVIVAKGDGDG
ncbi:hypothetical protein ACIPI2_00320 [Micrococcus luteus]|uniref:hypothetical protein n=1 Tax=Micrococcus luteus TaxID=1270 RepID=UPI00380A9504